MFFLETFVIFFKLKPKDSKWFFPEYLLKLGQSVLTNKHQYLKNIDFLS